MKRKKVLSVLLSFMLVISVLLTGCGAKETDGGDKSNNGEIDADQTVNLVGYDFSSLDPCAVNDMESFTVMSNVYEGLFREVEKDGKPDVEKAVAEDVKISDDGLVYTFKLRDAKWSDDKPVTAHDYEYAWKRLVNPDTAADYGEFINCVKGVEAYREGKAKIEDVGIKAVDDKTFEVTLEQPTVYFEKMLAFGGLSPQRQDIVEKYGKEYGSSIDKTVYNGPFVVSEYAKGSKIVYAKNEKYWDAKNIKLQKAVGTVLEEPTTIVKMFETKELDMAGASGDDLVRLSKQAESGEFKHVQGALPSVFYYTFNHTNEYLKNPKIRLAISLAYDRQQQIDIIWKRNIPAFGMVPPVLTVGDDDYRQNIEEPLKKVMADNPDPKKLLAEGLQELGKDPDPSKIKLTLLQGKANSTRTAQAQYIQNQLKKNLGINIEIKYAVDGPSYFSDRQQGNFDICTGGWGADFNDALSFFSIFTSNNPNNEAKYKSAEYDNLIKKLSTETDQKKRLELFRETEELLLVKDAVISPYFYQDVNSFEQNYMKGMYIPAFSGYYILRDVYVQGK